MTISEYNSAVDTWSDNVYRFVLSNIRDVEVARDIVQDSFEKLWIKRDSVDNKKVKSYLFTTAHHTLIDYTRRQKFVGDFDDVNEAQVSHTRQFSDLNEILHKALDQLPEQQKSVILLRDYEGYSYEEISEMTELTLEQVKVYIFRGRKSLKQYLGSVEAVLDKG